jgi:hypothetical protein
MIVPQDGLLLFLKGTTLTLSRKAIRKSLADYWETVMPRAGRPVWTTEDVYKSELNMLEEMFRSGVVMAIPAAMHLCSEHGLAVPPWLTKASTDFFCVILRHDSPKTPVSAFIARLRRYVVDYVRWDEVNLVQEQQKYTLQQGVDLRALPKTPYGLPQKREKLLKETEERLGWLGNTLDRAYECASERLAKTRASGGRDTVEKSYYEVEHSFNIKTLGMRYYQLDPLFLRNLGLKVGPERAKA